MVIFHKIKDVTNFLCLAKDKNKTIGFVPTMGALHKGHISLITSADKEVEIIVCSIFVNPTQFNDVKDYEKYPITIAQDVYQLEKAGCTVLFLPSPTEMYPGKFLNERHFELGYLETILDGKYRPGHFQGVCQVVHKLLEIILPDKLYLGQKDYQQCLVLKKMTAEYFPEIFIKICPTQREINGLAMSSRNLRLSVKQQTMAAELYASLQSISHTIKSGNLEPLLNKAIKDLTAQGFKVDYIEIANATTLQIINDWNGKESFIILIAAFLDDVRLIDNLLQSTDTT